MSTAMQTTQKPRSALAAWVSEDDTRRQIAAAVGDTLDADLFASHMLVALNDPKFSDCNNASKARAVLDCAALALLPTAGQVALIPYRGTLKAMPQWQGYKAVMERHPSVLEVQAFLVHKSDVFGVENGDVQHSFDPLDPQRTFEEIGDIRGGYCKIIYRDGRPPRYHFVTAAHIKKARGCAETQAIWKKWFEQMALKTLYRDCYARRAVPVDPLVAARMERITAADDVILGNDPRQSVPTEGSRSERFLSRVAPEPEAEPQSTSPHQAVEDAAAEEVAAGPSGTTEEVGHQPEHPDNAPEDEPGGMTPAEAVEALFGELEACKTPDQVDAVVGQLEGVYSWLDSARQDMVRTTAVRLKRELRGKAA